MPRPLHATPDPAEPTWAPNLADELWTNAHLCRYFHCGTTKLANLKQLPDFPRPAVIAGLQRYVANQVRAYALSHQQASQQPGQHPTPAHPANTTTEGATP